MPIKIEPFVNPFRRKVKDDETVVDVVKYNGKTYEKLVRKK